MNGRQRVLVFIFALLPFAILLGGWYIYMADKQDAVWEQAVSNVLEVSKQGAHAFDINARKDMQMIQTVAEDLSQNKSGEVDDIVRKLSLPDASETRYVCINLDDRVFYSSLKREGYGLSEDEIKIYRDLEKAGVREPFFEKDDGQKVLGYYQKFYFADGKQAMLEKLNPLSNTSDEFSLSFYGNTGFSYVINKDGDILVRPSHQNSNQTMKNIYDIIGENGRDGEKIASLKKAVSSDETGTATFDSQDGGYVYAYVPLESVGDWHLVSIIPSSVITQYSDKILQSSQTFAFILFISLIIFSIVMTGLFMSRRNVKEKVSEIIYREQMFNILANDTNDVFLMLSANGKKVEYVSPNIDRVLGFQAEEVIKNLRVLDETAGEDGITVGMIEQVLPGEPLSRETERIHRRTGERRQYIETLYRASVENIQKYILSISDRTEERNSREVLEEALKTARIANESKSAFLSNMSHDIRTPMNAIVGLCTLMNRDAGNEELVREYTRQLATSSEHLLGLINDILDMSKIESGKTTLNISEISLADITNEINMIIYPQTKAKKQHFDVSVSMIKHETLLGDKVRINQILFNILSNAVKYTDVGGTIQVFIEELPQKTKNFVSIRFTVKDNGQGMSKEYQKTIFEPFTRELNRRTEKIQGTGLGMPITKNLIDLMGGTIQIDSEVGRGTTVIIELRLRIPKEDVDQEFWKNHGVSRTLVVDDEAGICANIMSAMSGTGVDVQYALDGHTAVEMVCEANKEEKDYDIILLDWKMPVMDGIQTAKEIRKAVPKEIAIMILTAYDWTDIEDEARAAGIKAFLPKPFFLTNFKNTIERLGQEPEREAPESEETLEGCHILVAEDNMANIQIMKRLLPMVGATCEIAENGEEAVKVFEASEPGHFDVILMDVQMPIMDGYEATRKIRAGSHVNARKIPIIAMTANAFAEDVQQATEAGMDFHIAKPINMKYLQKTIRRFLDRKQ